MIQPSRLIFRTILTILVELGVKVINNPLSVHGQFVGILCKGFRVDQIVLGFLKDSAFCHSRYTSSIVSPVKLPGNVLHNPISRIVRGKGFCVVDDTVRFDGERIHLFIDRSLHTI